MKLSLKNWKDIISAIALATGTANATDLVWTGGTGNWNAAANWSPAQVPTASDNAWITNNGAYTVTVPVGTTATSGSLVVGGASGTQTVAIDRATLTLNGASVVNLNGQLTFLVAQSVLNGAGNLTVNGTLDWANGTMAGTGVTTINSGGVLAIGSGGVTLGRTFSHNERVERVAQVMDSLDDQEEIVFVGHVECVADLIKALRGKGAPPV